MITGTCIAEFSLPAIGSARATQKPWPTHLMEEYRAFAAQGGFVFTRGSDAYQSFLLDTGKFGVRSREYWHAKSDPRTCPTDQVFYLAFSQDKEYERSLPPVWETFISECNERKTRCTPFEVREPLVVDLAKTRKLDLLEVPNWSRPRIFLVSARAREVLESIKATGVSFRHCNFSSGKQKVATTNPPYFEMLVATLDRPIEIDPELVPAEHRCTVCGTVESYVPRGPVMAWLDEGKSALPDFFCINSALSPQEKFELGRWEYFASARVLAAMIGSGLKGSRAVAPSLGITFLSLFRDRSGHICP